jgi:predicted transcriptional regulator
MEVILPPDVEAKLSRLADEQGRDRGSLAVERMVDHDTWFIAEVEKGLADLERGAVLSHEELGQRLEDRLAQRRTA